VLVDLVETKQMLAMPSALAPALAMDRKRELSPIPHTLRRVLLPYRIHQGQGSISRRRGRGAPGRCCAALGSERRGAGNHFLPMERSLSCQWRGLCGTLLERCPVADHGSFQHRTSESLPLGMMYLVLSGVQLALPREALLLCSGLQACLPSGLSGQPVG
jgi:hypothetical protein